MIPAPGWFLVTCKGRPCSERIIEVYESILAQCGALEMPKTETLPSPDLSGRGVDKWRREQEAFHRLLPDFRTSHRGQFVAIHEGRVVESGEDKLEVGRRAYEQFGYVPIFVSQVVETPVIPVRVPSPRLCWTRIPSVKRKRA